MRSNSPSTPRPPGRARPTARRAAPPFAKKRSKLTRSHALAPHKKHLSSVAVVHSPVHAIANIANTGSFSPDTASLPRVTPGAPLNFDDGRTIYQQFSTSKLLFTNTIYSLCRVKPLVQLSPFLIRTSRTIFGDKFVTSILKNTIYKQFCIGEDAESIASPITKAAGEVCGLSPILDWGAEPEEAEYAPIKSLSPHNDSVTHTSAHVSESDDDFHSLYQELLNLSTPCKLTISNSSPNTEKRYSTAENRYMDAQLNIFKVSVDAASSAKRHLHNELVQYLADVAKASLEDGPAKSKLGNHAPYTVEQLANMKRVYETPTFIAIKMTALAPPQFLERSTSLLQTHHYLWDVMFKQSSDAHIFHTDVSKPLLDDAALHDSISREQFVEKLQEFYAISEVEALRLFDDAAYGNDNVVAPEERTISRLDWTSRLSLLDIVVLSSRIRPEKVPAPPANSTALSYASPTWHTSDAVNDSDAATSTSPHLVLADVHDIRQLAKVIQRVESLAQYAQDNDVSIFVDAEQSYYQGSIDYLCGDLMRKFNRNQSSAQTASLPRGESLHPNKLAENSQLTSGTAPTIWQTYQCYLTDAAFRIRRDVAIAEQEDFTFACKIVRGAYMEAEHARAQQLAYSSPIQPNIEATHNNYDQIMYFLLNRRRSNPSLHLLVASHNADTVAKATSFLEAEYQENAAQLQPGQTLRQRHQMQVFFAQLFGMGNRLTYPIAQSHFPAYKYMVFGPVLMSLPYLIRRARENGSMLGGTVIESKLIKKELRRRFTVGIKRFFGQ